MENYTLNLNTNAVEIPVVRDGCQMGSIKLYPDDTVFLGKFYALLPKLEKQRQSLAESMQGKDNTEAALDAMQKLWKQLRSDIDDVFGQDTCKIVFGDICSLTIAQQFFEGIGNALQTERAGKIEQYTKPQEACLK